MAVVGAERLDEEVDIVRLRGGCTPREVGAAADEDERDSGEHCSPRRKAGAGELHLREELREEIPHLRACYEERVPRRGPLRADQYRIRGERRLLERRADEAPVVHDDACRRGVCRQLVGEASRNRDRRLGIVRVEEVGEHAPSLGDAQPLHERVEEHRVLDLPPTVRAEPHRDESSRRDDVVRGEGRGRNALRPVPRVDAGGIGARNGQDLLSGRPLRADRVELVREERFRLGARHEGAPREREGERIEPGHVERREAGRAADELEEEAPVGRRHPTGAECHVALALCRSREQRRTGRARSVTPARGRSCFCGLSAPSPSGAGLKKRRRSRGVTLPRSAVSPS